MNTILLYMPSGYELIVILLVVVLLFGGKKIPELMRGVGKGVKEFKNGMSGADEIKREMDHSATEISAGINKQTTQTDNPDSHNTVKK
ncbi:MAG TPA: twin-arginine translocase TatA/TatE family subunit [Bacteroidales bacterium]|nr:twin-arginine translocase TatA/TatE family subunit [Bacteroidales bacterium]